MFYCNSLLIFFKFFLNSLYFFSKCFLISFKLFSLNFVMFISIYFFPQTPFRRRIGSNNKDNQQSISHPVTYNNLTIKTAQFQQTTSIYNNYCHPVTNKSQNFKSWTQSSILSRISENSTKATPTLTPDQTKWNLIKGPPTRTPDQNF